MSHARSVQIRSTRFVISGYDPAIDDGVHLSAERGQDTDDGRERQQWTFRTVVKGRPVAVLQIEVADEIEAQVRAENLVGEVLDAYADLVPPLARFEEVWAQAGTAEPF